MTQHYHYHKRPPCVICKTPCVPYHAGKCRRCSPTYKRHRALAVNFCWERLGPLTVNPNDPKHVEACTVQP